jgi:hypothetical protein
MAVMKDESVRDEKEVIIAGFKIYFVIIYPYGISTSTKHRSLG